MRLQDDIEVILYEDKQENSPSSVNLQPWSAKGRFGPNDVHHQVNICCGQIVTSLLSCTFIDL